MKGCSALPSSCKADNPWIKLYIFSWHPNMESAAKFNKIH